MTKAAAAKHLNVVPRTLERYVQRGRITGEYVKGDKSKEVDFKFEDVERLRLELEAELKGPTRPDSDASDSSDATDATPTTTALARVDSRSDGTLVTTRQPRRDTSDINVSLLSLKRLFTLEEVELLTGISKDRLRKVIASGELVAGKDGRGWKVLPAALDAFLEKRFGGATD